MPNTSLTWSSMDRCWAVTATIAVKSGESSRAWISGATLDRLRPGAVDHHDPPRVLAVAAWAGAGRAVWSGTLRSPVFGMAVLGRWRRPPPRPCGAGGQVRWRMWTASNRAVESSQYSPSEPVSYGRWVSVKRVSRCPSARNVIVGPVWVICIPGGGGRPGTPACAPRSEKSLVASVGWVLLREHPAVLFQGDGVDAAVGGVVPEDPGDLPGMRRPGRALPKAGAVSAP